MRKDILRYDELKEMHRWIPVSEKLPRKITKAQLKNYNYPFLLVVNVNITNSFDIAIFNKDGYFDSWVGGPYSKEGEDAITHWKKIYSPNKKHRRKKNIAMMNRFELLDFGE